ncbi:hypothetical protein DRO54_08355 [Candidatus Bathyarchaeota archaeon]|nr:MAG: hypothetical protein DRO54_08355 [Candidatus Bathyarchaeota archaeon]
MKKNNVAKCLVKTFDYGLKEILGEAAASIVYEYLETKHSVKKEEIPDKIEDFIKGLKNFLSTGAFVVERVVLEKLYESYGLKLEEKEQYSFEDYLDELRKRIAADKLQRSK